MRDKHEILTSMTRALSNIEGIEGKRHMEWITLIEVLIDIRDVLRWCHEKLDCIAKDYK